MSKVERLNARVAKLLTVAVQEVLEVIKETVSEYQEKTARTQRENERLRRRLQELQDKQRKSSIDLSCSIPGAGPPVSGGTFEKTPTHSSLDNLTLKQELNTETLQCSEHTPADVEQIIIKCDSPREQNEVSCQGMSASQNDDITEDTDEDSVHFVACYKNSVAREIPKTRKSHRLTRNCKIETKAEEPSEAKTTPEKELFGDDQLSIRESLTIPNCGLIETQHSQLRHDDMLKTDSSVRVKVDTSPGNTSHTSLSGTAGYSYLTVQTQIKTEVDTDDCSSSIGAPQRDDYVTDFNGLRDEPELTQDQQAVTTATTVAASASSSCKMSYIPFSSNATGLQHDGLILENGYETQPQEPASGSVGVQFSMGPMSRRGLSGVSGGGGAVMGGRLPRPYTRHHHHPNHTGAPKRYCCAVCGRSFNHAGDFKKHKRVHTGEKPYACGVCGKRFSQSGYLTVHLRYHTGERPYSCGLCGRSFSHSSNFRKHQQTHIGQMLSNT